MSHRFRFRRFHSRRRNAIKGVFQLWSASGKAGTPPGMRAFGKTHQNWMPFIARMDRKYSHRIMRKNGMME